MWLGLGPMPSLPDHCPLCSLDISEHPWHAFSCKVLKRKSVPLRHDRAWQLFLRFARDHECTGFFVTKDLARVLPDGHMSHVYGLPQPSCLISLASMYMLPPTRT